MEKLVPTVDISNIIRELQLRMISQVALCLLVASCLILKSTLNNFLFDL